MGPTKVQPSNKTSSRGRQAFQCHSHLKVRGLKFKNIGQVKKLKGYFKRRLLKIGKARQVLKIKENGLGKIKKLKQKVNILKLEEKLYGVKKRIFYKKLLKYVLRTLTLKTGKVYKSPLPSSGNQSRNQLSKGKKSEEVEDRGSGSKPPYDITSEEVPYDTVRTVYEEQSCWGRIRTT